MRRGDVSVRQHLPHDPLGLPLMVGVQEREQEADRHRVHALGLEVLDLTLQPFNVQLASNFAAGVHALGHAYPEIPRRERLDLIHSQVVPVLLEALAYLQQVTESLRGNQAYRRSLALHERVRGDRRAVYDDLCPAQQLARVHFHGRGESLDTSEHAVRGVVGRSGGLEHDGRRVSLVHRHQVSKSAADVNADSHSVHPFRFRREKSASTSSRRSVEYYIRPR